MVYRFCQSIAIHCAGSVLQSQRISGMFVTRFVERYFPTTLARQQASTRGCFTGNNYPMLKSISTIKINVFKCSLVSLYRDHVP